MAKNSININEQNLYEWLCSVGYLLPSNEQELVRFEALHLVDEIVVNEESVDPFAIINGTRQRQPLSFTFQLLDEKMQEELRMAARHHQNLPQDIIDCIKRNQQSNDHPDRPENS
jgi:hypothetical protein